MRHKSKPEFTLASEFVDAEWFTNGRVDNTGIVLSYNDNDGFKARIGVAHSMDEQADARHIMNWGVKLPYGFAKGIFGARMRAEWIKRHLADTKLKTIKYDGKEWEL